MASFGTLPSVIRPGTIAFVGWESSSVMIKSCLAISSSMSKHSETLSGDSPNPTMPRAMTRPQTRTILSRNMENRGRLRMVPSKVPLVHSWYKTRSHPSELTAGFYNTVSRDGDEGVVEILQGIRGVNVWGQNSTVSGAPNGFEQIKKNLLDENKVVDLFTYQRMGVYFFSPDHFPKCTEFVRRLTQPELHLDDLLSDEAESVCSEQGKNLHMQVA
ncbi:beta-amylase 3 [Actinidia rufa]|uniref:Beta-amylase 3 n=1 Tax=Actinidia rufa TaxID=165716 RepID=A0A7J0GQU2_9ERIC|nr:beta-amylase 3 [Actinidia rufa]